MAHTGRSLTDREKVAGANQNDKMKNIYDLEGNNMELTAEASSNSKRVCRGGRFTLVDLDVYYPASYRDNGVNPTATYGDFSSRAVLHINI